MSGPYKAAMNQIKNDPQVYPFFQSLLYGTLAQAPYPPISKKIFPLHHYNFSLKQYSECIVYLHQLHVGILVCVNKDTPGLKAYFNIKNLEISQFSYEFQLDQNIKKNQYLVLKDKQDIWVLLFRHMNTRNHFKDRFDKVKTALCKINDTHDPSILKAFIKADTNQSGQISWDELKSLIRLMKIDLTASMKEHIKKIIGRQKIQTIDFSQFSRLWKVFYCRNELIEVFQKYNNNEEFHSIEQLLKPKLDTEEFKKFLMEEQKQSKQDSDKIVKLLYGSATNKSLSFYDFCHYIFGHHNNLLNNDYKNETIDIQKPLNHYYCYSSHNTYLTGDQLFSDSRVERYLVDLENGLRCVEIDVHDGPDGPIVKHGYTPTSSINFQDVILSIKRFADLHKDHTPIILSLEVHCSVLNQQKMAYILKKYLQPNILLIDSSISKFPTLKDCQGKIIIKGPGDYQLFRTSIQSNSDQVQGLQRPDEQEEYVPQKISFQHQIVNKQFGSQRQNFMKQLEKLESDKKNYFQKRKQYKKAKKKPTEMQQVLKKTQKQQSHQKFKISRQFLLLITMLSKGKAETPCFWQSTSFSEGKLISMFKDTTIFDKMSDLSKQKWFRSYPDGLRIMSSNYDPIPALQLGFQIVAINTQSKNDVNSHILKAFFTKGQNKYVGYREKVEVAKRSNMLSAIMNTFMSKISIIKAQIKFISGLRIYKNDLSGTKIPPVEVRAYFTGSQRDKNENSSLLSAREFTETVYNEAFNPKFNKIETLEVKCYDPELGFLIIEVPECGRSVIPIDSLKHGWRVISLYDEELKQKQSKILCHIELSKSTVQFLSA